MRSSRRHVRGARALVRRFALALAAAAALVAAGAAAAAGRTVAVRGIEMNRYGRIALEFSEPTKVQVKATNGVLVLTFPDATKIQGERLVRELPSYLTQVRHDPDGLGLRLALAQPWRTNVLEAAEKVFIDLLPANWTGLLPALPPEVVDALARRARDAEARAGDDARRQKAPPRQVAVRVAKLPTLTRLVLEGVGGVPVSLAAKGPEAEVRIEAPATLALGGARAQMGPAVRSLEVEASGASARLKLVLEEGYEARGFREDDSFVVDVAKPRLAAVPAPEPAAEPAEAAPAAMAEPEAKPAPRAVQATPQGAPQAASQPALQAAPPMPPQAPVQVPAQASPQAAPQAPPAKPQAAGPVSAAAKVTADGLSIEFPFRTRTAAAAFERNGIVTVLFETAERLELDRLPTATPFASLKGVNREGTFAVLRFALAGPFLTRLSPKGEAWVLSIGETGLMPSEPVAAQRSTDDLGRTVLNLAMADAAGVYWLEDGEGGERIAIAAAHGPPRGIAKPQRFVEFRLLPTAHGIAVAPDADDVTVRSGTDGVTVSREMGLALTTEGMGEGAAGLDPVLHRDRLARDRLGSVLARQRELMDAVAEAPRSGRSAARIDLARFLVANRLDFEAVGVLQAAAAEDPTLVRQRPFLLLQGIALARMHRVAEARRVLATDLVAEDPEAVLWRALLDARARRFAPALGAFRRSKALVDLYPDDIQVGLRTALARAAVEMKDLGLAESELTIAGQLGPESAAFDEIALLKGRIAEAGGRADAALDLYRRLAETAERPVAAEAALRYAALALDRHAIAPEEAIARLETLSVVWRGDEIEAGALGRLGRLYAQGGRWRDAFTVARRATRIFPDHEVTRALHEETGRLFEDLFLSGKGEALSRVDALALYFDFKEFTPIGRRGDEIVRRLADRLVELDLLDQAGDLLWHQVEHRLTGAARATVAARLATVRLMDGKPQAALQAIQATRLPQLPAEIKRARILLEARALSDLSRTDLALEVIAGESGPEIDRLRADILWTGRRWRDAGEAHERLVGLRWQGPEALDDRERLDVLRAAIAYSLAEEALALDRLRTRLAPKMADSRDARTFAMLTQPRAAGTRAFREAARGVTSADTLADFLAEYRKRYPEAAVAERRRAPAETPSSGPSSESRQEPQAQAPAAGPARS
jgi:tetratricopeptide (TPR) repeat protein